MGISVPDASAYNLIACPGWPGGEYEYYIDADSFRSELTTTGVSTIAEYEHWIQHALRQWPDRSGAAITYKYGGLTTGKTLANRDDGISQILAATCATAACDVLAYAHEAGRFGECDIVVASQANHSAIQWGVATGLGAGEYDLVGTLVHEMGHCWGLAHENSVTMNPAIGASDTRWRFPREDDANGLRALYGTREWTRMWRSFDSGSNTIGAVEYQVGGYTRHHAKAMLARGPGGLDYVVSTNASAIPVWPYVHFTRAEVPLSGSSVWSNVHYGQYSPYPPAVASDDAFPTPIWVAVWAREQEDWNDPNATLSIRTSTDAFLTSQPYVPADVLTDRAPDVTYDPVSGWFLIFFVRYDSASEATRNRIFAIASQTGGTTWTAPQDTGQETPGGLSVDCGSGGCVLSFLAGGHEPLVQSRAFTVDAAGQIVLGSTSTRVNWFPMHMDTSYTGAGGGRYPHASHFASANTNSFPNAAGVLLTVVATSVPIPTGGGVFQILYPPRAGAFALGAASIREYFLYPNQPSRWTAPPACPN